MTASGASAGYTPRASGTTVDNQGATPAADWPDTPRSEQAVALADLPPLISVPTAARALGLSRSAAYRYAAAGDLPVRRLGGRVFVVTALLRELVSTAEVRSAA